MAVASCAPSTTRSQRATSHLDVSSVIDSIADAAPLNHTTWGIEVRDQATGRILYTRNADKHMIPASSTKIVATSVAMGMLGPDFRYRTPMITGAINDAGSVSGVLIEGSGDPSLSARFWGRPFAAAAAFADSLYSHGVRRITGPLMVDASLFTDGQVNGAWEVSDLTGSNGPPVAAFAMEEGMQRLVVAAGAERTSSITLSIPGWPSPRAALPAVSIAGLRSDTASSANVQADFLARRDSIYLTGRVPVNRADTGSYAVTDAAMHAALAVAAAIDARGIQLDGPVTVIRDRAASEMAHASIPSSHAIAVITSPPLSEIARALLHTSQNWMAEMLLKTIGAQRGTTGSWSGGIAVERKYLTQAVGLDSLEFNLRDGSGLSAQNLITPHALVTLLEHDRKAAWADAYSAALPAPGEPGTLENRLKELQGRVRAKTGTISNVSSLAGYLTTADGRRLTFAVMTNGTGLSSAIVRRSMDDIVRAIAGMH
jgi:D-alanyl-D-alanine carboxypeptidase/D-alanyl-D-alanine-endopeptidase (penicillin-binding protein 4)